MIRLIDYHKLLHSNLSKAECMHRIYRAFAEDRALSRGRVSRPKSRFHVGTHSGRETRPGVT